MSRIHHGLHGQVCTISESQAFDIPVDAGELSHQKIQLFMQLVMFSSLEVLIVSHLLWIWRHTTFLSIHQYIA